MIQVKQLVRKDRNCKKGQQLTRQTHLPIKPKTAIRNANAVSTPIRQHFPYLQSIPVRLVYDTSETFDEKGSKWKKRTTTDHTETLTSPPKMALRIAHAVSATLQ